MNYQALEKSKQKEVAELFTSVFTSSEGEKEGVLIGNLSSELASSIDDEETICFGSYENESLTTKRLSVVRDTLISRSGAAPDAHDG